MLWLAGRGLVGKEKAKFTDAIWIVALGTIIGMIIGFISTDVISFSGLIIALIQLIVLSLFLAKSCYLSRMPHLHNSQEI